MMNCNRTRFMGYNPAMSEIDCMDKPKTPQEILKSVFGYDSFRPMQAEIIAERAREAGHTRRHADRRRKVSMLSGAGPRLSRSHRRRLAAHRPHAGSGFLSPRRGRRSHGAEQYAQLGHLPREYGPHPGGRSQAALPRARKPRDGAGTGTARDCPRRLRHDRRGALHLGMGA